MSEIKKLRTIVEDLLTTSPEEEEILAEIRHLSKRVKSVLSEFVQRYSLDVDPASTRSGRGLYEVDVVFVERGGAGFDEGDESNAEEIIEILTSSDFGEFQLVEVHVPERGRVSMKFELAEADQGKEAEPSVK